MKMVIALVGLLGTVALAQDDGLAGPPPKRTPPAPRTFQLDVKTPGAGLEYRMTVDSNGRVTLDENGRRVEKQVDPETVALIQKAMDLTNVARLPDAQDDPHAFNKAGTTGALTVTQGGKTVARVTDFEKNEASIGTMIQVFQALRENLSPALAATPQGGRTIITEGQQTTVSTTVIERNVAVTQSAPDPSRTPGFVHALGGQPAAASAPAASGSGSFLSRAASWIANAASQISDTMTTYFGGGTGVGYNLDASGNLVYVPGQGVKVGVPTGAGSTYVPPSSGGRRR